MDTITCPKCGQENAFFSIMDDRGANYECPDCDYEWCDTSVQIEDENKDNDH